MSGKTVEPCPHYRILVIGKCGAGKSSLINNTFGITDAKVSDTEPGEADIEHAILSSKDKLRFLLHDSLGFENGENSTVDAARRFIQRRNQEPQMEEKVHVIWLCVGIPIMGARLIETSVEEFLDYKEIERVPIIVVFTKYDRLVSTERRTMTKEGSEASIELAEEIAGDKLLEECISPLRAQLEKSGAPYVPVSTRAPYKATLDNLIDVTSKRAEEYIRGATATKVTQKFDASVKIRASIAGGAH